MRQDDELDIDFAEWAALAQRDPQAFEARRARLIERFIDQAPSARRHRLRQLQWRIDAVRRTAPNPLAACVRISNMMWDSLLGERGLLEAMARLTGSARPSSKPAKSARVLEFSARR